MKKLIIQLFKFSIVGVIAAIIDFGVLTFLKEIINLNVLLSSAVAFSVSVIANYILSMMFVFKGGDRGKTKEFVIFVALSIGGLILNQFLMWLGVSVLLFHYLFVKVFACVFVAIYNFITRKIFLERNRSYEK